MARHALLITLSLLSHVPVFPRPYDDLSIKPVHCATLLPFLVTPAFLHRCSTARFQLLLATTTRKRSLFAQLRTLAADYRHFIVAGQSSSPVISGTYSFRSNGDLFLSSIQRSSNVHFIKLQSKRKEPEKSKQERAESLPAKAAQGREYLRTSRRQL